MEYIANTPTLRARPSPPLHRCTVIRGVQFCRVFPPESPRFYCAARVEMETTVRLAYRRRKGGGAWPVGDDAFFCPVGDEFCCAVDVDVSFATTEPSTCARRALALRRCSSASASQSRSSRQLGHDAVLGGALVGSSWSGCVSFTARPFELLGGIRLRHEVVPTGRVGTKPLAHACGMSRHRAPRASECCARRQRQIARVSTLGSGLDAEQPAHVCFRCSPYRCSTRPLRHAGWGVALLAVSHWR